MAACRYSGYLFWQNWTRLPKRVINFNTETTRWRSTCSLLPYFFTPHLTAKVLSDYYNRTKWALPPVPPMRDALVIDTPPSSRRRGSTTEQIKWFRMVFSVQMRERKKEKSSTHSQRSLVVECLAADATNPGDIVSGLKNVVFRSGLKMRGFCDDRGKMELERERQKSRSNPRCAIERIFDSNPGSGQIITRVIQYPCQIHRGLGVCSVVNVRWTSVDPGRHLGLTLVLM